MGGDEGDDAVILGSGSCLVEVNGTRVGQILPGGFIGEAVVLGTATHRTATVRCSGEVIAYKLKRAAVLLAFEKYPAAEERVQKIAGLRAGVRQALAATNQKESPALLKQATKPLNVVKAGVKMGGALRRG